MIKGVIFDFDGTLAHKKKSMDPKMLCEMLRENGVDVYYQEWEAAHKFVFFVEYPKGKINSYEDYFSRVLEVLGIKPKKEIVNKIVRYARENDRFDLFPDVKFIRGLKIKKAILTTIPFFRFDHLNLAGFDPVFTGKEIGRAKPHPNGFLGILKKWNLKSEEVLMVGDDLYCDILPARQLGIRTVFIVRQRKQADKGDGEADFTISSLKEIARIIK